MIKIWFEPHSTTLDNDAQIASGWNDVDLSKKGFEQSLELVKRTKERGIEVIFCADLQRAVKSAMPSSNELHIPIFIDQRLRECNYGDLTQQPKEIIESEKPKRVSEPFPNGESYEQVIARMRDFLDWLKNNFEGKTVMIIGHRGTHYGLENLINNKPILDCVTEKFVWQPGWEYELN